MRPLRAITVLLVLAGLAAVPACVTESVTPATGRYPGMKVQGKDAKATSPAAAKTAGAPAKPTPGSGPAPALPDGPVATPATTSKTVSSRVEVGVIPMGVVAYDGQALPLVSPDGHFIAVQEGQPPTWEAILAEPAAAVPSEAGIAIYEVGEHELKRLAIPRELPSGLILGRGGDQRGFLVEAPQSDGARWIGRIAWAGGGFEWLVRGPLVASHATLTSRGELVYTSRAVESDSADLVIQGTHGDQSLRTPGDGLYAFPMCTQDANVVYVLHLTQNTMELEAIHLDRGPDAESGTRAPTFGATIARRGVAPKGDMTLAFQMASTVQPALPVEHGASGSSPLAIFHPRLGRMTVFNLETVTFDPLASKSFAAIPSQDADRPGYFCATQEGLVFAPPTKPGTEGTTVRVVAGPYMPRKIRSTPESLMLFGQVKGRGDQFEVVKMVVGPEAAPAKPPRS
jgi:hypothetical protein